VTYFLRSVPAIVAYRLRQAKVARQVYAVDVSVEAVGAIDPPENFSLIISDGVSVPVPGGSVDVAWSAQLMEHLHPDDAREQLGNIYRALKPGGVYICITPNRISGPHDISNGSPMSRRVFICMSIRIGSFTTCFVPSDSGS